jgi:hypothetical protein
MKKLQIYIVCHDKRIIKAGLKKGFYPKDAIFLLVGDHSKGIKRDNVINVSELPINIEYKKNMLVYTAYYALVHNNLINSEYCALLEYDVLLDYGILNSFDYGLDVYGFQNRYVSNDPAFLNNQYSENLQDFFRTKGVDLDNLLKQNAKENKYQEWIATTNAIYKSDFLKAYINDPLTNNFFDFLQGKRMAGHDLERYLSIYCMLEEIDYGFVTNVGFKHAMANSHETGQHTFNFLDYIKSI